MLNLGTRASLETLSSDEAAAILGDIFQHGSKLVLTFRDRNRWVVFSTKAAGLTPELLWFYRPESVEEAAPEQVLADRQLGVSLRRGNFRFFFTAKVNSFEPLQPPGGPQVPAFQMTYPECVHRLSRRAARRVDVPENQMAHATIWPVGLAAKQDGQIPDLPVWSGNITNISTGGFQMRPHASSLRFFEAGDIIGVGMVFGKDGATLECEAEFRYGSPDGPVALLGFRFIGLGETDHSRQILEFLSNLMDTYQPSA